MIDRVSNVWTRLPPHFRIEHSLHPHIQRTPFELDLLLNNRLQYLQVLFLLHGAESHGGESLLEISEEMLSLVVDAIVLRDRLVNSGVSLIWKVSNYGLRAAGMVSLSLLRSRRASMSRQLGDKTIQNLCVLVSEIQGGGFVSEGEPNFDLLNRAASSIQRLLTQFLRQWSTPTLQPDSQRQDEQPEQGHFPLLDATLPLHPWETDIDFWELLAEHPIM